MTPRSPPATPPAPAAGPAPELPPESAPDAIDPAVATARLRIVIVNYRTPGLTIDCLASLRPELDALPNARVLVVEGGSGDDSADRLRDAIEANRWADRVTLDVRETNAGFAGGNNAALRAVLDEEPAVGYVLLLNPDTVVRPGAVVELLRFMEEHPAAGLAGSRLEDPDGTPQNSAFRFPSVAGNFENGLRFGPVSRLLRRCVVAPPAADAAHRTGWLAGASLMVRREVFDAVGLLDDRYFMYFEETDFCLAAERAGFEAWYVPTSRVIHLVGAASGVTAKNESARPAKRRPAYWFESRRRYHLKNHGPLTAAAADAAWLLGLGLWRLRVRLCRLPDRDPEKLWLDSLRHSVFARGFRLNA
ncbi:MAG: glycosyltransferase family 2 protein [Planctomycetota bacterium]